MRIRQRLRTGLIMLMSPITGRTKTKIREQQHYFAASLSAQLISSTGETPGITPALAGNNGISRYSKQLTEALDRYSILEELQSSRKCFQEPMPGIGVNLLVASRWLEEESLQLRYPLPFRAKALQKWWEAQQASTTVADEAPTKYSPAREDTKGIKYKLLRATFRRESHRPCLQCLWDRGGLPCHCWCPASSGHPLLCDRPSGTQWVSHIRPETGRSHSSSR